ncbi:yhc3p [Saccharomyces arboricola H-6]|uniref:Protein BTN n=1 Tax=Saccharomyces arboricola (strain H-6 / AS 2.3317 / CBS 10644) TaxID=1160507 RepID=J8LM75_SACAR|nr:yhc3p [Saccharomyces arboricola H-6]
MSNKSRQVYCYFWLFGLINNVLYVVILSAAVDIVGPTLPKSLVLLADIFPSLTIKLCSPFFIDRIKYSYRIWSLVTMSCIGMFLVSFKNLFVCLLGISFASLSSGFGEVTFLQLTHYYKQVSLNGWSSGTGGAGILGGASYMILTSIFKVPVKLALMIFSILPFAFLFYFKLDSNDVKSTYQSLQQPNEVEDEQLEPFAVAFTHTNASHSLYSTKQHVSHTLKRLQRLVFPYMLPLTTVYLFEYLINQAVSPTLLFPIDSDEKSKSMPFFFHKYRDIYVTYGTLYQLGVFISRSFGHLVRIKNLYILASLQGINLCITILQSWFYLFHSPWAVMVVIFYEGFLGGASYINTFLNILEQENPEETEFAMGAVSIADSFGVFLAALLGLGLEPKLCEHQVSDNRPWCRME